VDQNRKEMLIARVQSGQTKFSSYIISQPTLEVQERAAELYEQAFEEAMFEGLITRDEALDLLLAHQIWTADLERELLILEEDIDKVKIKLYEMFRKKRERAAAHKILKVAKKRRGELLELKSSLEFFTAEGFANWVKYRFLVRNSISPAVELEYVVDSAIAHLISIRPTEGELREIARTEPWRSIWAAHQEPPKSEEHRTLICLSQMYDHIYEASEPPSEEIIADDDALDGWLLKRRKENKSALAKKGLEDGLSDKIANSQEIFIMAEDGEEAEEIENMNDSYNRMIKRQREAVIKQKGTVGELDLPDIQRDLQIEMAKKFSQNIKG